MEKVCFKLTIDAGLVLLVFDIAVASVDHSYVLFYQRIYDVLLKVWAAIAKVRQSLTLTLYHSGPLLWRPLAMAGRHPFKQHFDHNLNCHA